MEESDSSNSNADWAEMLPEALVMVFSKLSLREMFMSVPLVCSSWRNASLDPLCWERVDLRDWALDFAKAPEDVERMVRLVVDRSAGGLKEFSICDHGTDSMLEYISERCRSLRCLRFPNSHYVTDPVFCKVVSKFPDLEELDISGCMNLSKLTLQEVGESCKRLFRLERKGLLWLDRSWSDHTIQDDEEALIIAKTMPHLRHLEISDTLITNEGLLALLEGCTGLEYLDVRGCRNLSIEKETAEKCYKLKYFHITDDWDDFSDYSYYYEEVDGLSDDIMEFYDPYDPYNYFNEINWWLSSGS
eukprot:TRINITY_DN9008_c0_g1_i1.p1 TRINITY_DN9008_c0_g1~~TRINITY_DN9008_c0_g1_i1.p1  ORF type:complete len:303 (+),score=35.66 TRINITY_DN9008_c0_g1_i1:269-1177(+)